MSLVHGAEIPTTLLRNMSNRIIMFAPNIANENIPSTNARLKNKVAPAPQCCEATTWRTSEKEKKPATNTRDKGSAPTLRGGTHFTRGCLRWARGDSHLRLATRSANERTQTALAPKARTPSVERHIFFHGAMGFQNRVPRNMTRYKA